MSPPPVPNDPTSSNKRPRRETASSSSGETSEQVETGFSVQSTGLQEGVPEPSCWSLESSTPASTSYALNKRLIQLRLDWKRRSTRATLGRANEASIASASEAAEGIDSSDYIPFLPPAPVAAMEAALVAMAHADRYGLVGRLPIQTALDNRAPAEVIHTLLQSNPEGARRSNSRGDFPLHLACSRGYPPNIIRTLLRLCPSAARKRNGQGDLPLRSYLIYSPELDCSVVRDLLEANPEAATISIMGELPVHIASRRPGVSPQVLSYLLEVHPKGASSKDMYGNLPLHWSCVAGSPIDVVRTLLLAYPAAVRKPGRGGELPFHLSCCNGGTGRARSSAVARTAQSSSNSSNRGPRDVAELLLDAYPEAGSIPRKRDGKSWSTMFLPAVPANRADNTTE